MVRHEDPKSVIRALLASEISTFGWKSLHLSFKPYASTTKTHPFHITMRYMKAMQVMQSTGDIQELWHYVIVKRD